MGLFWRQFYALTVHKNWIVLRNHWFLNIIRNFVLPVAFSLFLAFAPQLLIRPNKLGFSSPSPIHPLADVFTLSKLVWTDMSDGSGSPTADQIMSIVTKPFSAAQLNAVNKVGSTDEVTLACPSNYNSRSPCFAAVTFTGLPTPENASAPLEYYITGDAGLTFVNAPGHGSDYEKHILPLQWAIDSALIELQTGTTLPTPLEQPFTQEDDAEQSANTRRNFLKSINSIFVIAFFLSFSGIIYQLAGSVALDRATELSAHLQAMGCLRSARLISWHLSVFFTYLPAWIISALFWKGQIFSHTNVGIIIALNLLTGLSLASWSIFLSIPFARSPQLAAVIATAAAIVLNIIARAVIHTNGAALLFILFFPSSFFTLAMRAIVEREQWVSDSEYPQSEQYPSPSIKIGPVMVFAAIMIFVYMGLAMWLEHALYDTKPAFKGRTFTQRLFRRYASDLRPDPVVDSPYAIEVTDISKKFNKGKKNEVVAIDSLSLKIPKHGVFVVLGSNGSGKSTLHGIIGNLISPTGGSITFSGGVDPPPRGSLGVVPQKNVLFPELTCYQTVRLWSAIKRPSGVAETDDSFLQLLVDCDLADKIHGRSGDLSGGQKRKLQLAIGLVGGSTILLVDEATSGVDPLSRRAIWRALNAVRTTRTIIFTTHFLDEADLLGDDVAILAAPGKLLAHASPVSLKTKLGKGYILHITMKSSGFDYDAAVTSVLNTIRSIAPNAKLISSFAPNASLQLGVRDPPTVASILALVESERERLGVAQYDTHGTSLEEVFLALMANEAKVTSTSSEEHMEKKEAPLSPPEKDSPVDNPLVPVLSRAESEHIAARTTRTLSDGRRISALAQALVIVRKRALIAKRSYVAPLIALAVLLCAACIPLSYLKHRHEDCTINQDLSFEQPLYLPDIQYPEMLTYTDVGILRPVVSPDNLTSSLPSQYMDVATVPQGLTFEQEITANYRNLSLGGVSVDTGSLQALVAYESSSESLSGPALLNLATNVIANQIRGTTGARIIAQYANFPGTFSSGTADALSWLGFFGLGISIFPAFATLYVTRERVSGVKAMQLSNGLTPVGLHLGHLLAEMPLILVGSTVVIVVWKAIASAQYADLGIMWIIFVLYGAAGSLFSYAVARFLSTALKAFATLAVYNVLVFIMYMAAYLLTLTYAPAETSAYETHLVHFTMSLLGPVPSILRAVLVSINLFSLRCNGTGGFSHTYSGSMLKYGGPITYLVMYIILLFAFLVWMDSGRPVPFGFAFHRNKAHVGTVGGHQPGDDVVAEASRVGAVETDPLRVLNVSKRFRGSKTKAVDDVSFGVGRETLGLLGPNGAGKTTTFNIIRGGIAPDEGDVFINGLSIQDDKNGARVGLGLCPQFTAIDNHLTVRDHLGVYGRLKGLHGPNLKFNIQTMLQVTALGEYGSRPASKLSGGNQRKLALAISLMGNPSVLLIDEYSTGIDPATKRHMWNTLRDLSAGKAVVITTHSMEEASALSDRVAILSGKMLAFGTVENLVSRYPIYEVHVSCRTADDMRSTQDLILASFPDARPAEDVSTRFEVPMVPGRTLSNLFNALSEKGLPEYAVERLSLESVFLKTIRHDNSFREAGLS